jgi:hypothetical protein
MRPRIFIFVAILLVLTACNLFPVQLATPPAEIFVEPVAGPSPTPAGLQEQPVPASPQVQDEAANVPTSPASQPDSFPTPSVIIQDLSVYEAALRPGFENEVQAVPDAPRYFIDVSISPEEPTVLRGLERVYFTNREAVPLDALYFRLYPNLPGYGGSMVIEQVIIDGEPVEPSLESEASALRVPLPASLALGETIDLTLRFRATLPTDTSAGYGVFTFADQVYALAGFYPTIPVYDDEGWNIEMAPTYGDVTFTDVAFYQVRLTVAADLMVATSGSLVETTEGGNGMRTWVAVGGPMRDFYVAMSADYELLSQEVDGTRVNSYYRSAQEAGGKLALQYAVEALRLFNEAFGPYPYAEFDVVATPTNAGGIEYPGIIVVAQGLYNQANGFFEHATAHEVAHQWWYGLVGNDQVDEPWLDESLTNYSAYLYYDEIKGRVAAETIKQQVFERPYQLARERGWDRAVAGPVESFREPEYGAIVYGKGPLFFDAVRERVGDEDFFAALRAYLEAHRYGIAYPEDLIEAFEETSGEQIDDLYEFWILGVIRETNEAGSTS